MSVPIISRSRIADVSIPRHLHATAWDMWGDTFTVTHATLFRQDPDEPSRIDLSLRGRYGIRAPMAPATARAVYSYTTTETLPRTAPAPMRALRSLLAPFEPEPLDKPAALPRLVVVPSSRTKADTRASLMAPPRPTLRSYEHTVGIDTTREQLCIASPHGLPLVVDYVEVTRRATRRGVLVRVTACEDATAATWTLTPEATGAEIPHALAVLALDHQPEGIPESIINSLSTP